MQNHSNPQDSTTIENIPQVQGGLVEDSPAKKRESTRSKIALFYVWAFFVTIGVSFIIGLIKSYPAKDYIDLLIAISGILSGPLGFIIGYYFKAGDKEA